MLNQLFIACTIEKESDTTAWKLASPVIIAIISAGIAYFIATFNKRNSEKKALDDQLDSILKIAVQYPYLEMQNFTEAWVPEKINSSDEKEAEKYQRYDIYTTMVFNYMERYCEFHEYTPINLKIVDIKTWIKNHQQIWSNPTNHLENINAYPEKFRCLIDNYIIE